MPHMTGHVHDIKPGSGSNGQELSCQDGFGTKSETKAIPSIIYVSNYQSIPKPNRQADKKKLNKKVIMIGLKCKLVHVSLK